MTAPVSRRTVVLGAAWSVPVIAAAIATPLAAASTTPRIPIACVYLQNNGHAGDKRNDWWQVTYNDGTTQILDNGTVQSDRELKALCGKKVHS
ncbi:MULTISPECIES: hypothetical protein [unclassified Microbacterium]|uniref:hypothetical protein n=1 Tax=unclassified Microbacterium TaxID=2609290 RepID=UPI002034C22A|nr:MULTISPECIES: hypothetical protein [unclassified Microbacterium]